MTPVALMPTPRPVPLEAVQVGTTTHTDRLRARLDEATQDVRDLQALVGAPKFSREDHDFLRDQIKIIRRRRVELFEQLAECTRHRHG